MSTQTKTKSKSQKSNGTSPSVVWFEIPADNVERARTFYGKLFGWKIDKSQVRRQNLTGSSIPALTMPRAMVE